MADVINFAERKAAAEEERVRREADDCVSGVDPRDAAPEAEEDNSLSERKAEREELAKRVAAKAILVEVHKSTFGVRRKVASQRVSVDGAQVGDGVSAEMVAVTKKLLKCDEYDAIVQLDGDFYARMMGRVISGAYRRGVYHLPLSLLEWFESEWAKYVSEREALVDAFIAVYNERVADARLALGPLFEEKQYPAANAVRASFAVSKSYRQEGVPSALADINQGLFEQERQRLQREFERAALEIRQALRAGLLELVDHLKEMLTPGPNGKPRKLYESTVSNVLEWLDLFDARNLTSDEELEGVVKLVREAMNGVDRDQLKENTQLRASVLEVMKASGDLLRAYVSEVDDVDRAFDFSVD